MSAPTLMNPNSDTAQRFDAPHSFDPANMRVVEVENASTGAIKRFDCYEIETEEKMFRLVGDEVQVRAVDWARSSDLDAEPEVRWKRTELSFWDVDQIRVFTWPEGELVRIYRDVN